MDPIERLHDLLTRLEDPAALSDEEIADTESELREVYAGLREADRADDDEALAWITEGLDLLDTESQARAEAAAERAQRLAELDARVEGQESDEEGAEAPAPVVGESEGEASKTAPKAAPEKAPEAEKVEAPKAEDETPAPRASEEHPAEEARAAAGPPRTGRASLAQIGQRAGSRPGGQPRERNGERNGARMFAAADVPGLPMGAEITDRDTMANAFQDRFLSFRGMSGSGEQVPVLRIKQDYPGVDRVGPAHSAEANTAVIDRIVEPLSAARGIDEFDALVAAGGVCGLGINLYDVPTLSSRGRPVRDALATVPGDRGKWRFMTPAQLSDIGVAAVGTGTGATDKAVAQVTNAQDVADYVKPHQSIACGTEQEATIYAVTNNLEAGVLTTRTSPETVAQWIELAAAAHDRFAEQLLLAAITTGSTLVTEQQDLGVARDFLNYANRAATAIRNRHRMPQNAVVRVIAPHWIVTAIQNDLWSAAFPGTAEGSSIDVTEAQIVAAARARDINLSFTIDSQVFTSQAAGKLTDFFTVADWWIFPEGTWAFGDGGTLDLGLFRDSPLVDANKVRIFSETFEAAIKRGVTSYRVRQTFCANGASAGTIDPNSLCDGGS